MMVCGVDCHRDWSQLCLLDTETGALHEGGKVAHTQEALAGFFADKPRPQVLALEMGRNAYFLGKLYESFADQVWLVDPVQVKAACAGRSAKTDRRDARAIATVVAQGQVEPLYVPDEHTQQLRQLTRTKHALTCMTTMLRNRIRGLLSMHGRDCPWRDLLGQQGLAYVQQLQLPGLLGAVLAGLLAALRAVHEQVQALEKLIRQQARRDPRAQLLQTLPGVGPFVGLSLAAEIGQVQRFAGARQLRGYSGLVPRIEQSGNRLHTGPLSKRGNVHLRYAAVIAAQVAMHLRSDNSLSRYARRQRWRLGPNPAKCATARKLLTMAFHMLSRGQPFRG